MIGKGRFLIMAVVALLAVGCGGKKDPNENIEIDSYVLASFFGSTEDSVPQIPEASSDETISTAAATPLENKGGTAFFFRDGVQTQNEALSFVVTQFTEVPLTAEDVDDPDGRKVSLLELTQFLPTTEGSFPKYVNNFLSDIAFSLNEQQLIYGFDLTVFAVADDGTVNDIPEWRFSEMLNWCIITFNEDVASEADIVSLNSVPNVLGPAESWRFSEDSRRELCPAEIRYTLIMNWLGRNMTAVQNAIQVGIGEIDKAFDEYTNDDYEAIRQNVLILDSDVPESTSQYQLWYELSINEFRSAEPYIIDLSVESVDYDTAIADTE